LASKVQLGNNYYGEYLPRKHHSEDAWVFQEAYADAFAEPHVLPSNLFLRLKGFYKWDGGELHKFYHSRSDALRALERATDTLSRKDSIKDFIEKYL